MRREGSPRTNVHYIIYRKSIVVFQDEMKGDGIEGPKGKDSIQDEDRYICLGCEQGFAHRHHRVEVSW